MWKDGKCHIRIQSFVHSSLELHYWVVELWMLINDWNKANISHHFAIICLRQEKQEFDLMIRKRRLSYSAKARCVKSLIWTCDLAWSFLSAETQYTMLVLGDCALLLTTSSFKRFLRLRNTATKNFPLLSTDHWWLTKDGDWLWNRNSSVPKKCNKKGDHFCELLVSRSGNALYGTVADDKTTYIWGSFCDVVARRFGQYDQLRK